MALGVLDASAILAFLKREPSAGTVAEVIRQSCASSVNMSETVGKLIDYGASPGDARMVVSQLPIEVIPFTSEDAYVAGGLRQLTSKRGLSLGDRCCLATAMRLRLPAYTSDEGWIEFGGPLGIRIVSIK